MFKNMILVILLITVQIECVAEVYLFEKYEKYPKLLLAGEYNKLTSELELVFDNHKNKIISDNEMSNIIHSFDRREEGVEKKFNEWVKKSKNSYIPRMMRGVFYYREAWRERGHKWANDTDKRQFIELRSKQYKAVNDFKYVISKNETFPHAYAYAISSYKSVSKNVELERLYKKFNELNPANLKVIMAYIDSKTPRWGGSYAEMQKVIDSNEKYIAKNPELKVIKGRIYSEMSDDISQPGNTIMMDIARKKLELINKAISYGDYSHYYLQKAYPLKNMMKYKLANEAITKAIELNPYNTELYKFRLNLAKKQYNTEELYRNASILLKLNYDIPLNTLLAGVALYGVGDYDKSIVYMNRVLQLSDNDKLKKLAIKYRELSKQKK